MLFKGTLLPGSQAKYAWHGRLRFSTAGFRYTSLKFWVRDVGKGIVALRCDAVVALPTLLKGEKVAHWKEPSERESEKRQKSQARSPEVEA